MPVTLRPLSTSQLLDQTFALYRKNFVLFAGIMAISQLVILAFQLIPLALIASAGALPGGGAGLALGGVLFFVITAVVSLIAYAVAQLATVNAVSAVYLDRPITVREAYEMVRGKVRKTVDLVFSIGIRVALGFMLLIIPGLRWMIRYSVAVPALAIEDLKAKDAMERSKNLTAGRYKDILLIYFLFVVLNYVVIIAVNVPILGLAVAMKMPERSFGFQTAQHLANFLAGVVVGPFITIAMSLVYYDQRVRKEAFDLQLMMQSMDSAGTAAAAAASSIGA